MTCNSQLELGIRVRSNTHYTDERHYEASHSGVWGLKIKYQLLKINKNLNYFENTLTNSNLFWSSYTYFASIFYLRIFSHNGTFLGGRLWKKIQLWGEVLQKVMENFHLGGWGGMGIIPRSTTPSVQGKCRGTKWSVQVYWVHAGKYGMYRF